MSLKTNVARGLKWQAISIVGRQLLSLVVFTTLARILAPSAFGLIGLVGVYLGFIGLFADQGIGAAVIQRKDLQPEHIDAAFWGNLGFASLLCLGTILLASPIANFFGEPQLVPLLRWSSLSLILSGLSSIHSTLFVKAMDFRRTTIRILTANSIGGIIGVSLALNGYGVWSLVAQQLSSSLAGTVFIWSVSPYRPRLRFSFTHFKQLLNVSWSVFATGLLWFVTSRFDQFIINRVAGIPALGLYVVASKVPEMAKTMTHMPLSTVSLPALSRLQDDHPKMCESIYRGMELNATLSFAIFVGLASISIDLVPYLFGEKWISAASMSGWLAIFALVNVLQVFFHPALLASGGPGKYVLLNLWLMIGAIIACTVGIQFGVSYLVLGLIINATLITIPAFIFLKHRIGLSAYRYCKPCLVPACAAIVMASSVYLARQTLPVGFPSTLKLAIQISVGSVIYGSIIWLIKPTSFHQLEAFGRKALGLSPRASSPPGLSG
jgi:O-antigen/teichoic acid export membrane protein